MLGRNAGTTVVTFLMVFVMQNTQDRDAKAIHLKLDKTKSEVPLRTYRVRKTDPLLFGLGIFYVMTLSPV